MRPGRDANEVVEGKEIMFVGDEEGREDAGTNDETSAGRESSVKKAHRDNIVGNMFSFICGATVQRGHVVYSQQDERLRGFFASRVRERLRGWCWYKYVLVYPGVCLNDSLTL